MLYKHQLYGISMEKDVVDIRYENDFIQKISTKETIVLEYLIISKEELAVPGGYTLEKDEKGHTLATKVTIDEEYLGPAIVSTDKTGKRKILLFNK